MLDLDSRSSDRGRLFTPHTDRRRTEEMYSNRVNDNQIEMTPTEINQLMESAKWAGILSDASDNEL